MIRLSLNSVPSKFSNVIIPSKFQAMHSKYLFVLSLQVLEWIKHLLNTEAFKDLTLIIYQGLTILGQYKLLQTWSSLN